MLKRLYVFAGAEHTYKDKFTTQKSKINMAENKNYKFSYGKRKAAVARAQALYPSVCPKLPGKTVKKGDIIC